MLYKGLSCCAFSFTWPKKVHFYSTFVSHFVNLNIRIAISFGENIVKQKKPGYFRVAYSC